MEQVMTALSTPKPALSAEFAPVPQGAIRELIRALNAQLGTKLADMFEGVAPADVEIEWSAQLAGFRSEEIERGLAVVSERRFPPTLGEFKNFCRPALDPEYAWYEAAAGMRARAAGKRGVWSHPAVYRAAKNFDYELRRRSFADCRTRWSMELRRQFAAGWGEPVPDPVLAIENQPIKGGAPSPQVRAHIARILGKKEEA